MYLLWVSLFILILALYLYIEVGGSDVAREIIIQQAEFQSIRLPNESAVMSSLLDHQGGPSLNYTFRNFTITSMWEPEEYRIYEVGMSGMGDRIDIKARVEHVAAAIQQVHSTNSRPKVLIALSMSVDVLALIFAGVFFNFDIYIIDRTTCDGEVALKTVKPDVLISTPHFGAPPYVKTIMQDDLMRAERIPLPEHVICSAEDTAFTVVYATDREIIQPVPHSELGVAIASQLAALGNAKWNSQDRVLVFSTPLTPFNVLMSLVALSARSQLVLVERGTITMPPVVETVKPTVLVSDDLTMISLVRVRDDFHPLEWLRFGLALARLNRGKLSTASLRLFRSVRLVHTVALYDLLSPTHDTDSWMLNFDVTTARILTGAQVIHALCLQNLLPPIAQTSFGDYRFLNLPGVNFGPVLPGVQAKVIGEMAHKGQGRLHVAWKGDIDTQIDVILRSDGCVYVPVVRHEVSPSVMYLGSEQFQKLEQSTRNNASAHASGSEIHASRSS